MVEKEKVAKVIAEDIAPRLESHGGGIELISVDDDGTVTVRLTGACGGCPGARMTLKGIVEQLLREGGVEFNEVVAV